MPMQMENALLGSGMQVPSGEPAAPTNALLEQAPPSPQQLLAPVLQHATDPLTGEVNYNKAFVRLASSPQTSSLAGGFLEQAVARGATTVPVALRELESEYTKAKLIGGAAQSLLPLGPNVTQAELIKALSSPEFSRAVPDPRMRAQILASAPRGGQQLAQWVALHAGASESAAKNMEQVMGGLHAKLAEAALAGPNGDTEALFNAPGWLGKAARKFVERYPQVMHGTRSNEKLGLLRNQLSALMRQEEVAQENYNTLAGPGAPPFSQWWEQNLAQQGLV